MINQINLHFTRMWLQYLHRGNLSAIECNKSEIVALTRDNERISREIAAIDRQIMKGALWFLKSSSV